MYEGKRYIALVGYKQQSQSVVRFVATGSSCIYWCNSLKRALVHALMSTVGKVRHGNGHREKVEGALKRKLLSNFSGLQQVFGM